MLFYFMEDLKYLDAIGFKDSLWYLTAKKLDYAKLNKTKKIKIYFNACSPLKSQVYA